MISHPYILCLTICILYIIIIIIITWPYAALRAAGLQGLSERMAKVICTAGVFIFTISLFSQLFPLQNWRQITPPAHPGPSGSFSALPQRSLYEERRGQRKVAQGDFGTITRYFGQPWRPRNKVTKQRRGLLISLFKKHTALFQTHNWEKSSFFSTLVHVFAPSYANM